MRQIHILFNLSKVIRQCVGLFTSFLRVVNMKLFCKSANQIKNNLMVTTLTKHVNNQTNYSIALEKLKKIWICLIFI